MQQINVLFATRIRKLELAGILVRVGVDRYALGELPEPVNPIQAVSPQMEFDERQLQFPVNDNYNSCFTASM